LRMSTSKVKLVLVWHMVARMMVCVCVCVCVCVFMCVCELSHVTGHA